MNKTSRFKLASKAVVFGFLAACSAVTVADATIAERVATHELLRDSVENGSGKYARLGEQDKARLLKEQDSIFALLRGKTSEGELTSAERAQLDRSESTVAQIVVQLDPPAGKPKMVCSYEARIGSNRKERVCKRIDQSEDGYELRRSLKPGRPTRQEG